MTLSVAIALAGFVVSMVVMLRYAGGIGLLSPLFLFSAVHVFYVFPKILALTLTDNYLGVYFYSNGTDVDVATSAVLCFLAFVLSYILTALPNTARLPFVIDRQTERKLWKFALIVGGLGLSGNIMLVFRNGGPIEFYFGAGFYRIELLGINVWLIFVSRFVYPALAVLLLLIFNRPTFKYIIFVFFISLLPILNILVLFRRSDLLLVAFISFYTFIYVRRINLRRSVVIPFAIGAFFAITLFPYLRQDLIAGSIGWYSRTHDMTFQQRVMHSFEVEEDDEIVRAASTIQLVNETGDLEFGVFVWNSLVAQFLPSSLLGTDFKQSLILSFANLHESQPDFYDPERYFYLAPMGFADAYVQFGILGFMIFGAFGYFVARIEKRSNRLSNRVFLILCVPMFCLAATNDVSSVPSRLATFWILTRFIDRRSTATNLQGRRHHHQGSNPREWR